MEGIQAAAGEEEVSGLYEEARLGAGALGSLSIFQPTA
jgi:hypothetical protein